MRPPKQTPGLNKQFLTFLTCATLLTNLGRSSPCTGTKYQFHPIPYSFSCPVKCVGSKSDIDCAERLQAPQVHVTACDALVCQREVGGFCPNTLTHVHFTVPTQICVSNTAFANTTPCQMSSGDTLHRYRRLSNKISD